MRLSLWLVLILAFAVGMCCAFAVRSCYFEATPAVPQTPEPTAKILVAKRTIPGGIEITADFVVFQEVPLSEVPLGSFTSFAQIYRRQPAYPIPADCPVCEDLLIPHTATTLQTAFVPTGNRIVTLDVVQIRQRDRVFSSKESVSAVLSVDQRVDIRVVLPESQGRLAEKRNQVLRTFASQASRRNGELILENVPIHQIQRHAAINHTGSTKNSLEFMLTQSETAQLKAAAKRGQIRIFVRPNEVPPSQPAVVEDVVTIADLHGQVLSDSLPLAQSLSLDIPYAQEPSPPTPQEADAAVLVEHVQRVASASTDILDPATQSVSAVGSPAVSAPAVNMLPLVNQEEIVQDTDQQNIDWFDKQSDKFAALVPTDTNIEKTNEEIAGKTTEKTDAIRNDGTVTFGISSFRSLSSDTFPVVEQAPIHKKLPSQTIEPSQESPTRPHSPPLSSEVAFGPRVNRSIQFLPPGGVAPVKESPQESAWQVESSTTSPMVSLIIPSAMPVPIVPQEKVSAYSPWERRVYTVLPSEELDRNPGETLPAPQRLLRGSELGTQKK